MKIAIVGHSQVPINLVSPGDTVTNFRKPGAKLAKWRDTPELTEIFDHNFDLTFIWLGSNDITVSCKPAEIISELNKFAQEVQTRCNTKVVIIEVETRCYTTSRHYVDPTVYLHIRRAINRKLHLRKKHTLLSFGALKFRLASDGVHFTADSRQLIHDKFLKTINEFRAGTL